jgi:hypothetical protein
MVRDNIFILRLPRGPPSQAQVTLSPSSALSPRSGLVSTSEAVNLTNDSVTCLPSHCARSRTPHPPESSSRAPTRAPNPPKCLKTCRRPAATSPCSIAATCPFAASALPTTSSRSLESAPMDSTELDRVLGSKSEHFTSFGGSSGRRGGIAPRWKCWRDGERT